MSSISVRCDKHPKAGESVLCNWCNKELFCFKCAGHAAPLAPDRVFVCNNCRENFLKERGAEAELAVYMTKKEKGEEAWTMTYPTCDKHPEVGETAACHWCHTARYCFKCAGKTAPLGPDLAYICDLCLVDLQKDFNERDVVVKADTRLKHMKSLLFWFNIFVAAFNGLAIIVLAGTPFGIAVPWFAFGFVMASLGALINYHLLHKETKK